MSTRIYIGGLPIKVESKNIEKKFEKYGNILSVDLKEKKDVDGNIIAKFAYINLCAEVNKVLECVSFFNGASWKGAELKVELAKESFLDRLKRERENAKNGIVDDKPANVYDWQKRKDHSNINNSNSYDHANNIKKIFNNNNNDYGRNDRYNKDDGYQNKGDYKNNSFNHKQFDHYRVGKRDNLSNNGEENDENNQESNNGKTDINGFQQHKSNKNNSNNKQFGHNGAEKRDNVNNDEYNQGNKRYKDANGFAQHKFKNINYHANNDRKMNRRQSTNHFGSDIPKPIEMIRYDPTKPQLTTKKITKAQNTEQEKITSKDEDINVGSHDIVKWSGTKVNKKTIMFGKMDSSNQAFKLNDALDAKDVDKSWKQKTITAEVDKSSKQKTNIPKLPTSFFIKPDDQHLKAAAEQFTKKQTAADKAEFEKAKPKLLWKEDPLPTTDKKNKNDRRWKGKSKSNK